MIKTKLILCEGKTDAVLLSYYLDNVIGWKPINRKNREKVKNYDVKPSKGNQSTYWYQKDDQLLLICGVGGKDNFGKFFEEKIKSLLLNTDAFEKVAIITDKDDNTIADVENKLYGDMGGFLPQLKNGQWIAYSFQDAFGMEKNVQLLLQVIPAEQQGALETVLLQAISENPYDKNIVDICGEFVDSIQPQAARYITNNRLHMKAWLSTTWAIQSPEKAFDFIDEQIRSVQWEKSEVLKECFEKVVEI